MEEYLELVFRRAPAEGLKFVADCDLWGLDFLRYARRVVGEVLSVARFRRDKGRTGARGEAG